MTISGVKMMVSGTFLSVFLLGCAASEPPQSSGRGPQAEADSQEAVLDSRTREIATSADSTTEEAAGRESDAASATDDTTAWEDSATNERPLTRNDLNTVPEAWTQEHQELRQHLTAMARQSRASDANHCVVAPFGHSACGGPAGYLVYSRENKSADELGDIERSLTRYNELDRIINTQRQVAGICRYNEAPHVAIYENRCVPQLGRQR